MTHEQTKHAPVETRRILSADGLTFDVVSFNGHRYLSVSVHGARDPHPVILSYSGYVNLCSFMSGVAGMRGSSPDGITCAVGEFAGIDDLRLRVRCTTGAATVFTYDPLTRREGAPARVGLDRLCDLLRDVAAAVRDSNGLTPSPREAQRESEARRRRELGLQKTVLAGRHRAPRRRSASGPFPWAVAAAVLVLIAAALAAQRHGVGSPGGPGRGSAPSGTPSHSSSIGGSETGPLAVAPHGT